MPWLFAFVGVVLSGHSVSVYTKKIAVYWREADDAQLVAYIDSNYGTFSARNYDLAVTKVCDDRSYHPVKDFFSSLPEWDGKTRVDTLLIDCFGAADNAYVRAVTRKTFTGAVARIMHPGCKFDTMLVMNGFQGQKKSSLLRRLCGEWFNDDISFAQTRDKTAAEKLQGYWIIEFSEMTGLKKADIEGLKAFISRQNDIYRASYGKRATPHMRQCIFIGTTNADNGFLRDTTGNRRYWPVKTVKKFEDDPALISEEYVRQFWAEALWHYVTSSYLDENGYVTESYVEDAVEPYVDKICSIIERYDLAKYDPVKPEKPVKWYRVRKSWEDTDSQKGAYKLLENAKKCADENPGYSVFDGDGMEIYSSKASRSDVPFLVRVSTNMLPIRTGPAKDYTKTGKMTGIGVFTIVEEKNGWGRLKSGAGWINLGLTQRL